MTIDSRVTNRVVAILLIQVPSALVLAISVLCWSVAVGCVAATKSYSTIIACRAFSGFFGAATLPCLTLVISSWYRKGDQSIRLCVCLCGVGASQLLGPFLSYALSQINSPYLHPWRIQFVFLAGLGVVSGVWILLALPSNPVSSAGKVLSTHETAALLEYLSINRTTVKNTTFAPAHLKAVCRDPQIYLLCLLAALISLAGCLTPAINLTIISSNNGKSATAAAFLLTTSIFPIVFTIAVGFLLQYTPWTRVSSIIVSMLISSIGATLLSCSGTNLSHELTSSSEISISAYVIVSLGLITATATALTLSYAASNIAGATKRVASFCLIAASFSIGEIFASLAQRNHRISTSPSFLQHLGFICLGSALLSIIIALLLWIWYIYANSRKEKAQQQQQQQHGSTSCEGQCEDGRDYGQKYEYRSQRAGYEQQDYYLQLQQQQKNRDHQRGRRRWNSMNPKPPPQGDEWVNRTDAEDAKFFYCY